MEDRFIYLDPSALLKLIVAAPETDALREELSRWPERVTSHLSSVEVAREVRGSSPEVQAVARRVFSGLALVAVDPQVLSLAANLEDAPGTTEAIHIATALSLGDDFGVFISYDGRMLLAADAAGLAVLVPGMEL